MNASQIPDRYVEMTADVVRLARAAGPTTRAEDIVRELKGMHPDQNDEDVRKAVGYAARALLSQHDLSGRASA